MKRHSPFPPSSWGTGAVRIFIEFPEEVSAVLRGAPGTRRLRNSMPRDRHSPSSILEFAGEKVFQTLRRCQGYLDPVPRKTRKSRGKESSPPQPLAVAGLQAWGIAMPGSRLSGLPQHLLDVADVGLFLEDHPPGVLFEKDRASLDEVQEFPIEGEPVLL